MKRNNRDASEEKKVYKPSFLEKSIYYLVGFFSTYICYWKESKSIKEEIGVYCVEIDFFKAICERVNRPSKAGAYVDSSAFASDKALYAEIRKLALNIYGRGDD